MVNSSMKDHLETGNKVRIAIYDMDKTITRRATYNNFLRHMALARAPWRLLLLPLILPALLLYLLKIWQRKQLKQFSQYILVGPRLPLDSAGKHLESHADGVLANNSYAEAIERIQAEKQQGYRHVLATASYRLYVQAIANRFAFDDVIGTELLQDSSGNVLPCIDGENCYCTAKLDLVRCWMKDTGLTREDCYIRAYSDHVSDAPLLEFADEAFATNPHPPLAQLAVERGWEIIDWRD